MDLNVGNIISQRGINYLIIDKGGLDLLCIPLYKVNVKSPLKFSDFKKIDFDNAKIINSREPLRYINKATDNIILYSLKKYKEYLKTLDEKDKTQRGSIIYKNNRYYYIYSEEGQEWITFEISYTRKPTYYKISISDVIFYTNFADTRINKKDNFKTIALCTQTDIDNISEYRKNCRRQEAIEAEANKRKDMYKFEVGDIIFDKRNSNYKRYIIIKSCPNTYECIEINDIKKANFESVLIKKKDVKLATNTSLKGIKWFEINKDFDMKNIGKMDYLELIFKTQYEYLKEKEESNKRKQNIGVGSIILKDNKYYYIFSEEGQNWIVFELNKKGSISGDVFNLDGEIYYTNYNQTTISKNDFFNVIYMCREGQIDLLRRRRRAYQKVVCENAKKADVSVVKIDQLSSEEYTVKSKLGDKLICTSNYDFDQKDARKHYLNLDDVVFVKVKQKRK